jgi:hydroxyacylglutathione hydrolase
VRKEVRKEVMEIHTLEALSDNYMYLIVDASTRAAAVVDPADPDVVMETAQRLGVTLTHVRTYADTYLLRSVRT